MKLNSLAPILYTEDISSTIDFCRTNFDVVCINYDETDGRDPLSNGDVEIMLSKPNAHIAFDKPHFTGSCYFRTNADELWNSFRTNLKFVTLSKTLIMVRTGVMFVQLHRSLRYNNSRME